MGLRYSPPNVVYFEPTAILWYCVPSSKSTESRNQIEVGLTPIITSRNSVEDFVHLFPQLKGLFYLKLWPPEMGCFHQAKQSPFYLTQSYNCILVNLDLHADGLAAKKTFILLVWVTDLGSHEKLKMLIHGCVRNSGNTLGYLAFPCLLITLATEDQQKSKVTRSSELSWLPYPVLVSLDKAT